MLQLPGLVYELKDREVGSGTLTISSSFKKAFTMLNMLS